MSEVEVERSGVQWAIAFGADGLDWIDQLLWAGYVASGKRGVYLDYDLLLCIGWHGPAVVEALNRLGIVVYTWQFVAVSWGTLLALLIDGNRRPVAENFLRRLGVLIE